MGRTESVARDRRYTDGGDFGVRNSDGALTTGAFATAVLTTEVFGVGVFAAAAAAFGAVTVEMVRVGVGDATVGAAAVGITFVAVGEVIEAVGAVGVDEVAVGVDAREAPGPVTVGTEAGATEAVEPADADTGGVETEDGVAAVGALGAAGVGCGVAGGFGGSFFATYSCAARVATRRKRTRRKMRPMTTARDSSEKKPHTTSPANPRTPAPMSYIPGMSGLCMVTPLARRQCATAPRLSPPQ